MPIIYVTGVASSGKSAVLEELRSRGYEAYGTDEDAFGAFIDNQTGENIGNPPVKPQERTTEWQKRYTWKLNRKQIKELATKAKSNNIFLCGFGINEKEVWDIFDRVFALVIDEATLRHRIESRTNNDFGKVPYELNMILEWQHTAEEDYKKQGAIIIDATQPIQKVVNQIVGRAEEA